MPPAAAALDGPTGSEPPARSGALSSSVSSTGNVDRYHAGTPACDAALWLRADAASAVVAASPDGDSGEEIKSEGGRELGGELEPRSLCARSALPSCGPIGRCGLATTSSSCHAQTDGPWPPRPVGAPPQLAGASPTSPNAAKAGRHLGMAQPAVGGPVGRASATDLVCQPLTPVGGAVCRGSGR